LAYVQAEEGDASDIFGQLEDISGRLKIHLAPPRDVAGVRLPFDFEELTLKKDHANRPFWVRPDGVIVLEAFSPVYEQV
jgi:hypothetical protein